MPHYRFPEATKTAAEVRRLARHYLKRMKTRGLIPPQAQVSVRYDLCGHTPAIDCAVTGPQGWVDGTDTGWELTAKFIGEQVESIRVNGMPERWYGGTLVTVAQPAARKPQRAKPVPAVDGKPSMTFGDLAVGDEVLMAMEHRTASDARPLPVLRRFTCTRFTRRVESGDGFADYFGIRRDFFEKEEIHLGRYRASDPVIALRTQGGNQ